MGRRFLVLLSVLLVLGSVPGLAAGAAPGPRSGATQSACATTSPADFADPAEDVLGWEDGRWYDEPIDANQSDGLNDTELRAVVGRAMARVEFIRCLEFEKRVPVRTTSREAFRRAQANSTVDPTLRVFDNVKFESLFLINETTDSIAVQNQNRGAGVAGFYSPADDEIVLVTANDSAVRIDETTLGHELVHALQDQHFNQSFPSRTRDGVNAYLGVTEGDPSLVDYRYANRCDAGGAWNGTCLATSSGAGGDLANVGVYLLKFQPYSDGPAFVEGIRQQGGWAAVNDLYADPPTSAEQVIHPGKFGSDAPVDVRLADRTSGEWRRVRPPNRPDYGTVGESGLYVMLWYPGFDSQRTTEVLPYRSLLNLGEDGSIDEFDPYNYDHRFSAGWDGDRLHVYRNDANETAYVWRIVWDSADDAAEFAGAYRRLLRYWGANQVRGNIYRIPEPAGFADAFRLTVEDDTVTIVNAPDIEGLSSVRAREDGVANGTTGTESPASVETAITTTPSPTVAPSSATPSASPAPTGTPSEGSGGTAGATVSEAPPGTATPMPIATPGFGLPIAVLAVLAAALLAARRA